jgi:hypothetical protein
MQPERYGVRLLASEHRSFIEEGFPGGLSERQERDARDHAFLTRALDPFGLESSPWCHEINLYLLGHLYERFGVAGKPRIKAVSSALVRAYRLRQMVLRRARRLGDKLGV